MAGDQCPGCLHTVRIGTELESTDKRFEGFISDFRELRETIRECINGVQSGVTMLREGVHRFDRNEQDFQRHTSGEDGAHSRLKLELAAMREGYDSWVARERIHRRWQWGISGVTLLVILASEHGPKFLALFGFVPK